MRQSNKYVPLVIQLEARITPTDVIPPLLPPPNLLPPPTIPPVVVITIPQPIPVAPIVVYSPDVLTPPSVIDQIGSGLIPIGPVPPPTNPLIPPSIGTVPIGPVPAPQSLPPGDYPIPDPLGPVYT